MLSATPSRQRAKSTRLPRLTLTPSGSAARTLRRQRRSPRRPAPCECVWALVRPLRRSQWLHWLCGCARRPQRRPQRSRHRRQPSQSTRYTSPQRQPPPRRRAASASSLSLPHWRLRWHSQRAPLKSGSRCRLRLRYGQTLAAPLPLGRPPRALSELGSARAAPLASGLQLPQIAKRGKMRLKLSAL